MVEEVAPDSEGRLATVCRPYRGATDVESCVPRTVCSIGFERDGRLSGLIRILPLIDASTSICWIVSNKANFLA